MTTIDDHLAVVRELIGRYGHMVQYVGGGPGIPPYAYTVGLFKFAHPELIIYGLPPDTSQEILNMLGERVKGGQRFRTGDIVDDVVVGGIQLCFLEARSNAPASVARRIFDDHPVAEMEDGPLRLTQVVWPDAQNLWPWQAGSSMAESPVIGRIPETLR